MKSADGQAAATWLSAVLSLVAIILALLVALVEQRRSNREKLSETRRDRERLDRFIGVVTDAIAGGLAEFDQMTANVAAGQQIAVELSELRRRLVSRIDVLETIRPAAPLDADLLLCLARAQRAMNAVMDLRPGSLGYMHTVAQQNLSGMRDPIAVELDRLAELSERP